MKIAMLSEYDYAGSGWQIARALRQNTPHSILHVKAHTHRYGYGADYILSGEAKPIIEDFVNKADIIHFKGDDLPARDWHGIKIPDGAKIIVTVGGSGFRRNGAKVNCQLPSHPISKYVNGSDFRTALSPDLNYPELKGIYTQYLIDSENAKYSWEPPKNEFFVGYYPGQKGWKGFESIIDPALKQLENEGCKLIRIPTINMSHGQSIDAKKRMTIFIDQISIAGCYGNSAIEAMQFGVPVIAYISEQSLRQSGKDCFRNSPVLNPGKTRDGLYSMLKGIFRKEMDLKEISEKTKVYCDNFHGYGNGSKMWDAIYQEVGGV